MAPSLSGTARPRSDGRAVELSARAFDTLLALIDARGSIVDKDALFRHGRHLTRDRAPPRQR
jgi:hypothetical protein